MTSAVIPRMQGDDYQARFFWIQACRLFEDHSKVARVGYELDQVKSFDDVSVSYSTPVPDERGGLVLADYYQVKFHVSQAGAFTWQALMDPGFIGAVSISLLQRLHVAQQAYSPTGTECRFHIVAPWPIDPDDALATLVSNQNGELRLHLLFDGTGARSIMGRIRSAWRRHLSLATDAELERVLRPLRIHPNSDSLEALGDRLNDKLSLAGLAPVDAGHQVHPFDDLIRKVRATGGKEFTQTDIREMCERNGLWRGGSVRHEQAIQIGVRSFMRWAEHMEDETDQMLCLVHYFDDRSIREPQHWNEAVFPEIRDFLSWTMREQRPYHIHLDTHSSLAFAAGYCLDSKSGMDVVPVQRTRSGRSIWRPSPHTRAENLPAWSFSELELASSGYDVALSLSVTHDVVYDVRQYVERSLPSVRKIVSCTISPGPSSTAVRDGTHALFLAQELASVLKHRRSGEERLGLLHIFVAAPNALTFFLGQLARGFGRCMLYEYDFDSNAPGKYQPSLMFPPQSLRA